MDILAIGPHPDDIEFGCGGTLIKYVNKGHGVYLLVMSDGSFGGDPELRMSEQKQAAEFIKVKGLFWGNFCDTEMAESRELILKIEEIVNQVKPDAVFLNYPDDVHQDHRAVAQAGISATRYIKEVLFYEVPTTQRFEPNIFVDIADALDRKLELLKIHSSQVNKTRVQDLTILASAQSCANFRGYQGRVKYAEGFKALRILRTV